MAEASFRTLSKQNNAKETKVENKKVMYVPTGMCIVHRRLCSFRYVHALPTKPVPEPINVLSWYGLCTELCGDYYIYMFLLRAWVLKRIT